MLPSVTPQTQRGLTGASGTTSVAARPMISPAGSANTALARLPIAPASTQSATFDGVVAAGQRLLGKPSVTRSESVQNWANFVRRLAFALLIAPTMPLDVSTEHCPPGHCAFITHGSLWLAPPAQAKTPEQFESFAARLCFMERRICFC